MILLGCGFHVLEAANGEEGLQIAKKHSGDIDLLMTDVVLPGINGMEVSERLKAIRPLVRVLFVSGYTADVIARRGVLNPGVSLLHKPFTADGLALKIRDMLAEPFEAIVGA
jgi:two-component system cell cycle sensor histidine kinase/response regulator CckA